MKIYLFNGKSNSSGERVRIARENEGITQNQLAARLQVEGIQLNQNAISRIETGVRVVADYELIHFAAVDSTIRSDMDYLRERFSIESRPGKDGGYRLANGPVFFIHAEMLYRMKKTIEQMGGISGYDADLMDQSIHALNAIKKDGSHFSL